jgi:uncharacterized membrane protein YfcA
MINICELLRMDFTDLMILSCGAFFAGFVDAIAGGGGLVQLPLLMMCFPALPLQTLFGTNKLASIAGTASAVFRYSLSVKLSRAVIIPGVAAALAGAALGAGSVHYLSQGVLKPLVFVLLLSVGAYTFLRPSFGREPGKVLSLAIVPFASAATGFALGFYDGFFGPGTGSFLIFVFVRVFGMDMLGASAAGKVINLATNLSAVLFFAFQGSIMWKIGIVMAAANVLGAQAGVHLALKHGSSFVRYIMILAVGALTLRLGYDLFLK